MSQRTSSSAALAADGVELVGGGDNGGGVATVDAGEEYVPSKDGHPDVFNLSELKEMSISKLTQVAKRFSSRIEFALDPVHHVV